MVCGGGVDPYVEERPGLMSAADVDHLAGRGRTVIAVSHDMRFVADSFERVVVLRAGEIVLDGPPHEVFAKRNWETLGSTFLEPPFAARVAARLGLQGVVTDGGIVAALSSGPAPAPRRRPVPPAPGS